MSDFEDIQRLLRLKRYEQPPEGFVEDFVRQFHHRQRQEIMQHSARGLLWERVNTYFHGLFAPTWRWAGATAVALVAAVVIFKPGAGGNAGLAQSSKPTNAHQEPISDAEVERYLISRHFDGGLATEHLLAPVSGDVQVRQQNQLPPLSIRRDAEMK